MARDKILHTARVAAETRLQDLSSLETRILDQVRAILAQLVTERIATIEDAVAALDHGRVYLAEIPLTRGHRSGRVLFEPVSGLTDELIGAPVIVTRAPGPRDGDGEGEAIVFTGEVLNTRQIAIEWVSAGPAPERARVLYLLPEAGQFDVTAMAGIGDTGLTQAQVLARVSLRA